MKHFMADKHDPAEIRRMLAKLARSYTPEWRFENAEDDPGAALAELFVEMFSQTVDRMNALPEKLYLEFLNQIGFQEPGPMPARGVLRFENGDAGGEPVTIAAGTEVFTPDEEGQNIVFSTERTIGATSAELLDIYYVSAKRDSISRLDFSALPQPFFIPRGMELQRHRFSLGEQDVLRLKEPSRIELHLGQEVSQMEAETAALLTGAGIQWSYLSEGEELPFDNVYAEQNRIILEKMNNIPLDPDGTGRILLTASGKPEADLRVDYAEIRSMPLSPCPVMSMYAGDLPVVPLEGGYCFGRRPAVYDSFYLRCDTPLSKKGAQIMLRLDMRTVIEEPERREVQYDFTRPIIDKEYAVEQRPDDVRVNAVLWEYFNGLGWHHLAVEGDRNPFSCTREGDMELRFQVPMDIEETEVNSETGFFLRVRVTEVKNSFSTYARWILPYVRSADFQWHYSSMVLCSYISSENNGKKLETEIRSNMGALHFDALSRMDPDDESMYFRFDRSPHAMPLSLRFQVEGRVGLAGQILWESWNGRAFEPVRALDKTDHLTHSGEMYVYLPEPVPASSRFGISGHWLRMSRSDGREGRMPVVSSIQTNVVSARQRQTEPEQFFDTEVFEAGKSVRLLSAPVQDCEVWVDELASLSGMELERLREADPADVRTEEEDHVVSRCWIRWKRVDDLVLARPEERCFELDPYTGIIRFGNGQHGKVPPAGDHNILVRYGSGGGTRGNVPAGVVRTPLSALPRIQDIYNLSPMSGGTGRLSQEEIEERGSRHLRVRGRAVLRRDYEDLVLQAFPQVRHVRCFSGRDEKGREAPGHVTVVLMGHSGTGEDLEELCRDVFRYLSGRVSCCLVAEGRLHVCPAAVLSISTSIQVEVMDLDQAADTQRAISSRIRELIDRDWRQRPIGEQIRIDEIWSVVRDTPNVRLIRRILVEGAYDFEGQTMLSSLEQDNDFPYAVSENGRHVVRIG